MAEERAVPRRPGNGVDPTTGPPESDVVLHAEGFLVERLPEADRVTYRFSGRCVLSGAAFQDDLASLRERIALDLQEVVFDLTRLEFVNSAFVTLVVWVVARLDERGRRLVFVGPNRQTLDLFGIVGILDTLDVRESPSA